MADVTQLLEAAVAGDVDAAADLLPLVYDELRRVAAENLARERGGQTLQATALVHEAYLRLVGQQHPTSWNGRRHFFAAAAEAMRRILIENARRKSRRRHGGGRQRMDLAQVEVPVREPSDDVIAVAEAVALLAGEDPVAADVVKLRYLVGLTIEETAAALDLSVRTANRRWAFARAWLYARLHLATSS